MHALLCLLLTAAPVVTWSQGLSSPESVLHDVATDTYLVSNVVGSPLEKDGRGWISELSPDGQVLKARWLESGKNGVELNAPKGLALLGGVLYVADLDVVRLFDRATGAPRGVVKVLGATFVNDLAVGHDGRVYLSDSGFTLGKDGPVPSLTDGLYALEPGPKPVLKTLQKGRALLHPNGLATSKDTLYAVTFGGDGLQAFELSGKPKGAPVKLPGGELDGVAWLGPELLVSSWAKAAVYRGLPAGPFTVLLEGVRAPADLGVDVQRRRVLVPRFEENRVEAYDVPELGPVYGPALPPGTDAGP